MKLASGESTPHRKGRKIIRYCHSDILYVFVNLNTNILTPFLPLRLGKCSYLDSITHRTVYSKSAFIEAILCLHRVKYKSNININSSLMHHFLDTFPQN